VPPLPEALGRLKKRDRYEKLAERAVADLEPWRQRVALPSAFVYPASP
jgi:hypothetical protein